MAGDMILVVDYGGTQAQSVARKLRGERVYCEVTGEENVLAMIAAREVKGLLLAGGSGFGAPIASFIIDTGLPVLAMGACARELCVAMGGKALGSQIDRRTSLITFADSPIFDGLIESERYFERVDMLELPSKSKVIAFAAGGVAPAFADEERKLFGLQFYAETNDPDGLRILSNFASGVCECEAWWTMEVFAAEAEIKARKDVGEGSVLMVISGGVDSAVCATLMHRAVGDQLKCLYVNTGLMRQDEPEVVKRLFSEQMGLELICVDASDRFIARLAGVTDADMKREIVADEMLHVIADTSSALGKIDCLAQGTIYPDVLSAKCSDNSPISDTDVLMNHIEFDRLVEPLRMLFKDEVRALGDVLGMPKELTARQPFPEAGLAVRCIGKVTAEKLRMLAHADAIFREEVAGAGLDRRIWQYFVVLTDMQTRCFRDGEACREYAVALRAVSSQDAISAYSYRLPYDLLERVVARITTEVRGIGRVLYDITGKPPAMIEWE